MIENIYFMSYFMSYFDFFIFIRSGIIQQERTNILDRLWNVRYIFQLQKPLHALLELVQLTSQLLPLLCQSITGNTNFTYFNILFQFSYTVLKLTTTKIQIYSTNIVIFFSPKINRNVKRKFWLYHTYVGFLESSLCTRPLAIRIFSIQSKPPQYWPVQLFIEYYYK